MHYEINKDWCKECEGSGHGKNCKCDGFIDFVMGCCKTCSGEGTVYSKEPFDKEDPTPTK